MSEIILIGAGGHAKSCLEVIRENKNFKVVGYISSLQSKIKIIKYLGQDKNLLKIRKKYKNVHLAIGFIKDYKHRLRLINKINKLKFHFPKIISKNSLVSKNAKIGNGTIIMNFCIVNYDAQIGSNSIINNKALIEHDVTIGSNCHISTSATINGNCEIGDNTFIGSGTIVNNGIKIGNNCLIGSGLTIKKNIKDDSIKKK